MRHPARSRLLAIGFLTPVLLIAALGMIAYRLAHESVQSFNWVTHTYSIITQLDNTLSVLVDVETAQRGYTITGRENYLESYATDCAEATNRIAALRRLVGPQTAQLTNLEEFTALAGQKLARSELTIGTRKRDGFDAARQLMANDEGKILMGKIRGVADRMRTEELRSLSAHEEKYRQDARRVQIAALAFFGADVLVLVVVVALLIRVKRLQDMVGTCVWAHHTEQGGEPATLEVYFKDSVGGGAKEEVTAETVRQLSRELESWAEKKIK